MGDDSTRKKGNASLHVLSGLFADIEGAEHGGRPTLDDARDALGGPWHGDPAPPRVGSLVSVPGSLGPRVGVVVHAAAAERDVWIGANRIRRVPITEVEANQAEPNTGEHEDAAMLAVADDARAHASLQSGQPVRFQHRDGTVDEGVLAEKLRYGSLVGLPDGRVLAVSFRRIRRLEGGEAS